MFVFLQSWRATLVPAIAIPVVLLGTFAVLYALDFSINTMTLFGLVLAVGLLVDDAIVVVENVERIMEENPELTPREATIMSMNQIQMALIAIALILSAVFLPMVFFGGSTGVIYRQFSATIVSAMVLSVFVAMTLSPAIASGVLKRNPCRSEGHRHSASAFRAAAALLARGRDGFNSRFNRLRDWYVGIVTYVVDRKWRFLGGYALVGVAARRHVLQASDRLPSDRGPGRDADPVPPAGRRDAGAHQGNAAGGRKLCDERPGQAEFQDLFHRRRRRPGRDRARMPASRSSTWRTSKIGTARKIAPTRSSSARGPRSAAIATRRCSR